MHLLEKNYKENIKNNSLLPKAVVILVGEAGLDLHLRPGMDENNCVADATMLGLRHLTIQNTIRNNAPR